MRDDIVYIPTPISVKPEKSGEYFLTYTSDEYRMHKAQFGVGFDSWFDGYGDAVNSSNISSWLRPASLSEFEKASFKAGFEAGLRENNSINNSKA